MSAGFITSPVLLGNPSRSVLNVLSRDLRCRDNIRSYHSWTSGHSRVQPQARVGTVEDDEDDIECPEEGGTSFLCNEDVDRFGTGNLVIVKYEWNDDEPDCVENETLLEEDGIGLLSSSTLREVMDKVQKLLPVMSVRIKTVNGSLTVTELPREDVNIYPRIPDSLALVPRITLSTLRKTLVNLSPHVGIDIVTQDDDPDETWYVFKRYQIPLDLKEGSMDPLLLSELVNLHSVNSQFIVKPSFLVTPNDDSNGLIGYLVPFMPAGPLEHVFAELVADQPTTLHTEPMLLHPRFMRFLNQEEWYNQQKVARLAAIRYPYPKLGWNLKHTWAIEITSALVAIHNSGFYSGKLRLPHVLLGRDGHLQMCSIGPKDTGKYLMWDPYRAPESDLIISMHGWPATTAATDIYALGIVLWQIAEEVARFEQCSEPNIIWRVDVRGTTPQWYQDIVSRCVDPEPLNRPSAGDVLETLDSHQ